jgi:DNA-binding PadR family transcriptional regulator
LSNTGALPSARKLSSAELQLVLLALLAESEAHGYELIKIIEDRSNGFYSPSPGVVYPALTYLAEVGFASVTQEGSRKLYRISGDGADNLSANREDADSLLDALSRIGTRMDQVREALAGVADFDAGSSDILHRARTVLKDALKRKRGSDPDELLRISQILERAAADILKR